MTTSALTTTATTSLAKPSTLVLAQSRNDSSLVDGLLGSIYDLRGGGSGAPPGSMSLLKDSFDSEDVFTEMSTSSARLSGADEDDEYFYSTSRYCDDETNNARQLPSSNYHRLAKSHMQHLSEYYIQRRQELKKNFKQRVLDCFYEGLIHLLFNSP